MITAISRTASLILICLWLVALASLPVAAEPLSEPDEAAERSQQLAQQVLGTAEAVAEELEEPEIELRIGDAPAGADEIFEEVLPVEEMESQRLMLGLTGNLDGNLARVDCRNPERQTLYWARQVSYLQTLDELAEAGELARPVVLNAGNSIFPGTLGRFLLNRGDEGPRQLADLLAAVPMEVHGLGSREFAAPRGSFLDFLEAMQEHQIAMQAANLRCESFGPAEGICTVLEADDAKPYRVVERQGIRLAVVTVLDEELLDRHASYQREGLSIAAPGEVVSNLVDQMRQEADLVIVQHQVPRRNALSRAYDLAKEVEGIDLVIASFLIDDHFEGMALAEDPDARGRMEVVEASSTGTPIISANSTQYSAINVDLELEGHDSDQPRWTLRRVTPRKVMVEQMPPHEATAQVLESTLDELCGQWGQAIGEHATLSEPMEIEQFQRFVLNIMRFSVDAEVALKNTPAFRADARFPLVDYLTVADVHAALPYENEMVVANIKGSVLAGLGDKLTDDVVGAGIAVVDGDVKINGRSPNPDRTYRVALNDYVAEGGDEIFSKDELQNPWIYHPDWSEEAPTLDQLVLHTVRAGEHLERGTQRDVISADDNFPNLHRRFLWTFLGSFTTSYNQVMVTNPLVDGEPGYEQSQLNVLSTDQLDIEGRIAANADSRNHGWNNDLTVQYAAARISDEEEATRFEETKDQIRLRSRYRYKRLRADLAGRWYIPDPVVEGQLESEFTVPDTRDWHRLDLRGILAASFQLADPLDVRVGGNIRQDINEPDGEATFGLTASYTLGRITPFRIMERPIRVESEVEYFYNDIGNQNIHEARSSNRVYFAFAEQFFFTTSFNAFLYRDDTVGELGRNTELTVGINYQWDMALQNF